MLITLKKMVREMYENENNYFRKSVGNYYVVRNYGFISHYYFGNRICYVDLDKKQFALHHCGYKNYRITMAQLNYLKKFYTEKGYELIYNGE